MWINFIHKYESSHKEKTCLTSEYLNFHLLLLLRGKPKITKINNIANRGDYQFFKDYYLPLRTAIKGLFIHKRHISYLFDVARKQKESSKKINFEKVAGNFKDWQSGKNITAYAPPKGYYNYQQTSINCNPELNVVVNGMPTLVKLHFNASDKMTQERANIICYIMSNVINDKKFNYSVLDLSTGKEYFFNGNYEKMTVKIQDEIQIIQQYWS